MLCLAANVDTLLLISTIVPRPAFPPLHSQSVGVDTLVLNTSDHGAGHRTSVFLQPSIPLAFPVFLVLHDMESVRTKRAESQAF
jgi:hypothetical protein